MTIRDEAHPGLGTMKTAIRTLGRLMGISGRREGTRRARLRARGRLGVEDLEGRELTTVAPAALGSGLALAGRVKVEVQSIQAARNAQTEEARGAKVQTLALVRTQAITNRDRRYTRLIVGKWRNVSFTNTVYGRMRSITEMVFTTRGRFTANSRADINGAVYFSGSQGTWRIRNNGILELRYTNVYPREYLGTPIYWPDKEFMLVRFANNNRFTVPSRGNAVWTRLRLL